MVENNIDNTSYGESSAHMCFRWLRDYHKSRKKNHESNRIVDVVEENEEYDHSEDSDCDIDDYLFERSKPRIYPQGCKLELKSALSRQMTEGITSDLESDDEQALKGLEIDIPWTPPLQHLTNLVRMGEDEKEFFAEKGIKLREGRWTYQELLTLKTNWDKFKETYKIKNPLCLLGLLSTPRVSKSTCRMFLQYLGRGLEDRTLFAIYIQARRMFNPKTYLERLSKGEQSVAFRLIKKYGNKWEKIGRLMGRSASTIKQFYWTMKLEHHNSGAWSYKEDKRLIRALTALIGNDNLIRLHHRLPWREVEKKVHTRRAMDCRERWLYILSSIHRVPTQRTTWKVKHDIKLIEKLMEFPYETESDVPWDRIYEEFPSANCFQLRLKWQSLRQRVPQWGIKSFYELVDWLVVNYLPKLNARLEKKKKKRKSTTVDPS